MLCSETKEIEFIGSKDVPTQQEAGIPTESGSGSIVVLALLDPSHPLS